MEDDQNSKVEDKRLPLWYTKFILENKCCICYISNLYCKNKKLSNSTHSSILQLNLEWLPALEF